MQTNSNIKRNNYLYFSFDAEVFDTEQVSKILNIKPSSVRIKKEPIPKSTSWEFKIEIGAEIDLETHLAKLIDVFEPKINEINALKEKYELETRLQFVIEIDINPASSTPYFGLNKRTIHFLSQTGTEVDFDVYKF